MKYENGQLISNTNLSLIDISIIETRNECICHCYINESCVSLVYIGSNRTCWLYASQIPMTNLQLAPVALNSVVITLPNRITTITTSTSSTITSTVATTAYCESTCVNTIISTLSRVVFYSFNGNMLDNVGNYSLNLYFLGSTPNYVPGWIGSAINFIYSDQQFLFTKHIPLDSRSFTIDFWFYATNLTYTNDYSIAGEWQASAYDECLFFNIRGNVLYMGFFYDDISGITTILTNQWYHATFVYDSTIKTQFIYLNGVLENSGKVYSDFLGTTGSFTIGGAHLGGLAPTYEYYPGYIDHFQISYRVKTPCEIYLNAILFCYFSFNLPSLLNDSGPNYLNAINSNGISTTGRMNEGIQFSSSSLSYVNISGVNVLNSSTNPFTISMWIKPLNVSGGGTVLHTSTQSSGEGNCFVLWGFTSTGEFSVNFISTSNSITSIKIPNSFQINQWTHIVHVFDPSNGNYLYINGNLMFNATLSTRQAFGSFVFLGASPMDANSCLSGSISTGQFNGVIDEFYVFSQALTSADICRLTNP
ncbi:unnamed protein product [Adineta ricciae]|uniref:LamG-like jellyroll fold domain-containing protein n=1 Tax=Adineta ricciae TaxID=249248 RepID=A0A815SFZ5_ADIRI|nr:unnamed protein product [Adineta ricciae]